MQRREFIARAVLSQRIGPDKKPLNLKHKSSRAIFHEFWYGLSALEKKAVKILCEGKDSEGKMLDLKKLDRGRKSIASLLTEVRTLDATLSLETRTGRILRIAQSVKILITAEGRILCEVRREYKDGSSHEAIKKWGVSETRKRGENALEAARRGVREELGALDTSSLKQALDPDEPDHHESSAYAGIKSISLIQKFTCPLPNRPWKRGKVVTDGDVKLHLRWLTPDEYHEHQLKGYVENINEHLPEFRTFRLDKK